MSELLVVMLVLKVVEMVMVAALLLRPVSTTNVLVELEYEDDAGECPICLGAGCVDDDDFDTKKACPGCGGKS